MGVAGGGREESRVLDVTIISQSITILPATDRESDILTLVQCVFLMSGSEEVISESSINSHLKRHKERKNRNRLNSDRDLTWHCLFAEALLV